MSRFRGIRCSIQGKLYDNLILFPFIQKRSNLQLDVSAFLLHLKQDMHINYNCTQEKKLTEIGRREKELTLREESLEAKLGEMARKESEMADKSELIAELRREMKEKCSYSVRLEAKLNEVQQQFSMAIIISRVADIAK